MTTTRTIVPGMHQGEIQKIDSEFIAQIWFSDKGPSQQYFWRLQFGRKQRGDKR